VNSRSDRKRLLSRLVPVLIFLILLAAILINRFWLLPHLDTHVFRGVPNFYTWIVIWNCHCLETLDFSQYWAGNAMYPYPFALALSEHMLGITPFAFPIWIITRNPVLTANLLSILMLWLTAIMMFWVLKKLIGARWPALVGALIFSLNPWIMKAFSLGRFHMLGLMWLPVVLYANKEFWETGLKRYLWMLGGFWFWTFTINMYLGIFLGIFLGFWNLVWFFLEKKHFNIRKIIRWLVCVALVWVLMVPLFLQYRQVARQTGMIRTLENQVQYTGPIWSWVTVSDENWLWAQTLKFLPTGERDGIVENYMFPGFLVLGFFVFGFFIRKMPAWLSSLRWTGLFMFILSMGPYALGIPWKIPLPFHLLWHIYPPLQATRNPHRLSLFVVLIIAVLAAYILKRFLKRKPFGVGVMILISLGIGLESLSVEKPKPALARNYREFYRHLKTSGQTHSLIELPVNIHTDLRAMVSSVHHWKRLVNGVSGLWPPLQSQLESEMREFPSTHSIRLLQSLEVGRIVIHERYYGKGRRKLLARIKQYPEVTFLRRSGYLSLWSLDAGRIRRDLNPGSDLKITAPSRFVSGKVNCGIEVKSAEDDVIFNLKAPSKFSFTPSRLWKLKARISHSQFEPIVESWRPPALFHGFNRRRGLELNVQPGHYQLKVEMDIMGDMIRLDKPIEVIKSQVSGYGMPDSLKLPAGYRAVGWDELKIKLETRWLNMRRASLDGYLDGIITLMNPGPFYWVSGQQGGVVLGVQLISDRKTGEIEFQLPNDLFPGDRVKCRIRIPLPDRFEKIDIFLNGLVREPGSFRKWFPSENRIQGWKFPED
jgi:hypothetical protein